MVEPDIKGEQKPSGFIPLFNNKLAIRGHEWVCSLGMNS